MTAENQLSIILADAELMADRGRLAVIDTRLAAIVRQLNSECDAMREAFFGCANASAAAWPQMDAEATVHERVTRVYALHAERVDLTKQRDLLERYVLPRLAAFA